MVCHHDHGWGKEIYSRAGHCRPDPPSWELTSLPYETSPHPPNSRPHGSYHHDGPRAPLCCAMPPVLQPTPQTECRENARNPTSHSADTTLQREREGCRNESEYHTVTQQYDSQPFSLPGRPQFAKLGLGRV